MLVDQIVEVVSELDEYVKLTELANDTKAQERLELRFADLNSQFGLTIAAIEYVMGITKYAPSEVIIVSCKQLTELVKENYRQKKSDEITNQKMGVIKKGLEESVKGEWESFYTSSSQELVNMLQTVVEITDNKLITQQIITRIEKGKIWAINDKNFELYISGMNEGQKIIDKLTLGVDKVEFLKNISRGSMTLADITPEILQWIQDEGLMTKFKVVF